MLAVAESKKILEKKAFKVVEVSKEKKVFDYFLNYTYSIRIYDNYNAITLAKDHMIIETIKTTENSKQRLNSIIKRYSKLMD